jgi:hypothetical protein
MNKQFKIKNMPDIKRHTIDGELVPVQNTVYVNPNKITIKWYNKEGRLLDDNYDGRISSHMWEASVEGIPTEAIRTIEYPLLRYDGIGDYLVKIVYDVYEGNVND